MGITTTSALGNIEQYRFNPVMLQRLALANLRSITNGDIDIVDGERVFLGENDIFVFLPEDRQYHMIESIGASMKHGLHRHITLQYPSLFGEPGDRLVFPE